ncbi:aldo/keto reductase [Pseudaeromonas sp. ZJS20]|uniref:aldo/keto reductase n=1 Tax=Pseudaeromonas aegiceratis TaxID=3153928 RepID=UPI00390CB9DB
MTSPYLADEARYQSLAYRRCGRSGLRLPALSLGLWHNFGADADLHACRQMLCRAFDLGITHFDLANNYGPPPGSAETTLGTLLRRDLAAYRDELILSSKAGYLMWPGPYGDGGSNKYLFASLHQSLKRMQLDYLDIFYHHRPDPHTPLEETMAALALMVKQGKALYVGLSNYPAELARRAAALLADQGVRCLINQVRYSLLDRHIEPETLPACEALGMGCIAFSPLAGGLLSDKYLAGIPADSRAASASPFLRESDITPARRELLLRLNSLAAEGGRSLSGLALQWVLRTPTLTSALMGASRVSQIEAAVRALQQPPLSPDELAAIEALLSQAASAE